MKLYSTLTRTLEDFVPLAPPKVAMYVCGPTVYDDPHIGHARSAFTFDILHRYLTYKGYQVTFVRNVTDVDDKIIEKARQSVTGDKSQVTSDLREKCREVSERYLESYHAALRRLGIGAPSREPKATEHVVPDPANVELTGKIDASMTGYIARLLTQGMAYPAGGDVYFSVRKLADYGKLSNRSVEELQSGARVEPGEQKQDPLDFALWKAAKPGEPSWPSPWGPGRPGWHIECTVMSTTYLGDAFDIHGGGVDLVFPHHENELAQARGLGKPFARYWVHNGLLTVRSEKMSKSLKNFITIDQALADAGQSADVLKIFFLGAHYRTPIDYSPDAIRAATKRYKNLTSSLYLARPGREDGAPATPFPDIEALRHEFAQAMDNDLNTPQALAVLDRLASQIKRWLTEAATRKPGAADAALQAQAHAAYGALLQLGREALGLEFGLGELGQDVERMFLEYKKARAQKNFPVSDQMRKELLEQGYKVQDSAHDSVLIPA